MNINTYIETGVLELYVLGQLADTELAEVEDMMSRHPEVRQEVQAIEETFEGLAMAARINPRPELRAKVMGQVMDMNENSAAPMAVTKTKSNGNGDLFRYMAAASVVLFLISAGMAINFWGKWQNAENRTDQLALQNQSIAQNFQKATYRADSSVMRLNETRQHLAVATDPRYSKVMLKGLGNSPESSAVVFWDAEKGQVYLDVNQLPTPPTDMQYQLWALADGKPVDAGVFSTEAEYMDAMQRMKGISKAQAFAVTLEKKGGSPTPNLEALYLMGEV